MKATQLVLCISLIFSLVFVSSNSSAYEPNWESLKTRPVPEWFTDAKFGIFIHWGIYSVPAWAPANADIGVYAKYAEWYWWRIMNTNDNAGRLFRDYHNNMYGEGFLYQDFAPLFKAEHFDPVQWAELFKRAGANYVVLTSKHHEGFALWPSEQSWNWNSVDIGPHRDICEELGQAVKNAGLKMGYYYSLYEWFNPMYHNRIEKYVDDHMLPQMKDLINRYEPDLFWPDGEWDHHSDVWKSTQFLSWLYNESAVKDQIVVNDRWGKETRAVNGDFYTTEYGLVHEGEGAMSHFYPWEECRGIGTSFGYNRIETPDNYMSSEALVHLLVEVVSKGGNLLLNVGPTADGRIPAIQQQKLIDMGEWLSVNGEAIYGTRAWPQSAAQNNTDVVFFTSKENDLYVICTNWPEKPIVINGISKTGRVSLLGSNVSVSAKQNGSNLVIEPPLISPATMPCNYAWVFKVENPE